MTPAPISKTPIKVPFFYGWVVVAVTFLTLAISVNVRTAFSLLFPGVTPWEWSSFIERVWRILDLTEGGQNEP